MKLVGSFNRFFNHSLRRDQTKIVESPHERRLNENSLKRVQRPKALILTDLVRGWLNVIVRIPELCIEIIRLEGTSFVATFLQNAGNLVLCKQESKGLAII